MRLSIVGTDVDANALAMAYIVGKRAFDSKRPVYIEHESTSYLARSNALGATVIITSSQIVLSGSDEFAQRLVFRNGTLTPVEPDYLPSLSVAPTGRNFGGKYRMGATGAEVMAEGAILLDKNNATIPVDAGQRNAFGSIFGASKSGNHFCAVYWVRRTTKYGYVLLANIGQLDETTLPYLAIVHFDQDDETKVWHQTGNADYVAVPIPPSRFAGELTAHGQLLSVTPSLGAALSFNTAGDRACGLMQLRANYGISGRVAANVMSDVRRALRWVEITTHTVDLVVTTDDEGGHTNAVTFSDAESYAVDVTELGGDVRLDFYATGESRIFRTFWESVYVVL